MSDVIRGHSAEIIFIDINTGEVVGRVEPLTDVNVLEDLSPLTMRHSSFKEVSKSVKNEPRGKMVEITCGARWCNNKKMVRVADLKRGWGKYCSKACAKKGARQNRVTFSATPDDDIDISDMDFGASDGGGYSER